eukprot:Partr_v1_DN27125_c1_g1_i1_m15640 putative dioxygenase
MTKAPPEYTDSKIYPYVAGFSNCEETPENTSCEISGTIPAWLSGVLYRAGPGIFDVSPAEGASKGGYSFDHWFDGISLLHRFEIVQGQKVMYRSRFMCRDNLKAIEETGDPSITFYRDDPCQSIFGKVTSMFSTVVTLATRKTGSNVNVTVSTGYPIRDKATGEFKSQPVLKTDSNVLLPFDPETLEEKSYTSYRQYDKSFDGMMSAAHEEYDPRSDTYYHQVHSTASQSAYEVFEFKGDTGATRSLHLEVPHPLGYIHSMASTESYVVLICPPYYTTGMLNMLWNKSFVHGLKWEGDKPTYYYVIDRKTMTLKARYQSVKPFWFFHTANAFEKDGDIFVDLISMDNTQIIDDALLKNLRNHVNGSAANISGKLKRYHLKDIDGVASNLNNVEYAEVEAPVVLADCNVELPRINDSLLADGSSFRHSPNYRYVYSVSKNAESGAHFLDSIVKIDTQAKSFVRWSPGRGHTPSEGIFVANPKSTSEDDGVVLSVVLEGNNRSSYIVILDAKTMKEVARAVLPKVVPYGFHGAFAVEK